MKILTKSSEKVAQVEQGDIAKKEEKNKLDSSSNGMALTKIIFYSLTIGCLCQLYGWSVVYLSAKEQVFEAVTDGNTDYEKLPAITFCKNQQYSNERMSGLGLSSNTILSFNKVKDYAMNISITSNYGGKGSDINYLMDDAIETISYKYYCFTINSRLTGSQLQLRKDQQLWIKLAQFGIYNSWWVYLHNSYDVLSSYEWISRNIPKGMTITISYNRESIERSKDNCQDYYMNTEYTSRRDCIRKCKLSRSTEECGVVYNGIDVKKTTENVKFASKKSEKSCIESMSRSGDYCHGLCPLNDCRTDAYEPYIISKFSNGNEYSWLQIIPPTRSQVIFKEKPKVNLLAYTFYLAGSFSVWLGFAIYLFIHLCRKPETHKDVQGISINISNSNEHKKVPA